MLTDKEKVRLFIQDNQPEFYFITDDELDYLLEKNYNNITNTALDASKIILLSLSMRGDDQVDIFSIKGSRSAEQYRLALETFLKNPDLNPALQLAEGYTSGISKADMLANDSNLDNNTAPNFSKKYSATTYDSSWSVLIWDLMNT